MKKYQPRLIVRDFNWDSAISESLEGTDAKTNFCGLLNFNGKVTENTKKTKFNMWPLLQDIQNNKLETVNEVVDLCRRLM